MNASVIANIALEPGGIISWILVGLIAGALAGRVVQGRGLGCFGDIIVGVVGAFIGAFLVGFLVPSSTQYGLIGTLVVAFIGSVILLLVIGLFTGRKR